MVVMCYFKKTHALWFGLHLMRFGITQRKFHRMHCQRLRKLKEEVLTYMHSFF